ncbi:MAG: nitrile hydratase accessory protein [Gammaproteobacteria bacterium]|nr:nitrile hydratase accessory protein [Gammaproteobacteria bacterium]
MPELEGIAAPPLLNGELDFEAPWQGRVSVIASALSDAGCFPWADFQSSLIRTIAAHEAKTDQPYRYYDHFLEALLSLLAQKQIVGEGELQSLAEMLKQLPPGRDHAHDHDHDHDHPAH